MSSQTANASHDKSAPTAPFAARRFDFSAVQGLSHRTLETHVALYEGYVKESNTLLPLIHSRPDSKEMSPEERLHCDGLVRRFAFERNGMVLHELFFDALRGPSEGVRVRGAFAAALKASYGSFSVWQEDVRALAQTRGVGWVLAVQSLPDNRLSNVWIDEHSHGMPAESRIVCAIDLWEHAYLIDYRPTERPQYVQTLFDNIAWNVVAERCER